MMSLLCKATKAVPVSIKKHHLFLFTAQKMATKIYDNIAPALVVPDHFYCNQSSTVVAIYNEPLGDETQKITLMFPGDTSGSSPKRIIPRRIDNRTLVFETPVYSASRGNVEVLPLLHMPTGDIELAAFKITLKHPVRNVTELCLKLSSHDAVLPVLMSLMMHCHDEKSKELFQDPHVDRILTTLVGSRTPGSSSKIRNIMVPDKKWRNLRLADFARKFKLTEMEKQTYVMKTMRRSHRTRTKSTRQQSYDTADDADYDREEDSDQLSLSSSTPSIIQVGYFPHSSEITSQEEQPKTAKLKLQLQPPTRHKATMQEHIITESESACSDSSLSEESPLRKRIVGVPLFPTPSNAPSPGWHMGQDNTRPTLPLENPWCKKRPPKVPVKMAVATPESPLVTSKHKDMSSRELRPQNDPFDRAVTEDVNNHSDTDSMDSYVSIISTADSESSDDANKAVADRIKDLQKMGLPTDFAAPFGNPKTNTFPPLSHAALSTKNSCPQPIQPPQPKLRQNVPKLGNVPKLRAPISTTVPAAQVFNAYECDSESDDYVDIMKEDLDAKHTYINTAAFDIVEDHVYDRPEISSKHTSHESPIVWQGKNAPNVPPPNTKKRLKDSKSQLASRIPQEHKHHVVAPRDVHDRDDTPILRQSDQAPNVPNTKKRFQDSSSTVKAGVIAQLASRIPQEHLSHVLPPRDVLRMEAGPPVVSKKPAARWLLHDQNEPEHDQKQPQHNKKRPLLPPTHSNSVDKQVFKIM